MTTTFELQAEVRGDKGRISNRRLRNQGKVPGVVYGGGEESVAVAIDQNALLREMSDPAFYTSILTVKIGSDAQSVVVKDVQRHPWKQQVLHLDFQRILADQLITLNVPIHFVGEDASKAVKEQGALVEHLASDLEIRCLPRHLPDFIEVDVSQLELNDIVHMSDLKLPEGVSLVALEQEQDLPLVTISPPRIQEEEEEEEAAVETDEAAAEGEAAQS